MKIELEELLPLDQIRQHTKTDDIPHVTDDLLRLYRKAAFEAAEKYTSLNWSGYRFVEQDASTRAHAKRWRRQNWLKLRYPASEGIVSLQVGKDTRILHVPVGARKVQLPIMHNAIDVQNCCNPCGNAANFGAIVRYNTGIKCKDEIPTGILLGCLKYIAWSVMNAGDEIMTARNEQMSSNGMIVGTNNAALASGALDEWRLYRNVT